MSNRTETGGVWKGWGGEGEEGEASGTWSWGGSQVSGAWDPAAVSVMLLGTEGG